jgi:P4 family phage/plasmid primase-like protien
MTSYFSKKDNALKKIDSEEKGLLCNRNITKYFISNNYTSFLQTIKKSTKKDFYEYIYDDKPIKLFFDIEIYRENVPGHFEEYKAFLEDTFIKVERYLKTMEPTIVISKIVLESHNEKKKSFHVIYNLKDQSNVELVFQSVADLKVLWKQLHFDTFKQKGYLIDPSVYRSGLFRTLYSSKSELPLRPLIFSKEFNANCVELDTFVQNISQEHKILANAIEVDANEDKILANVIEVDANEVANKPEDLNESDRLLIKKFVQKEYTHFPNKIREIKIDKEKNCIIIALNERYCPFVEREHRSNNQYILIDTTSSKQRCHDPEEVCNLKHNEIRMEDYPKEINLIIKKCLKVNKQELDLIDHAIEECKTYINENFDTVDKIQFDKKEMVFRGDVSNKSLMGVIGGKCSSCQIEHQISNTGYCMKCIVCKSIFPKNQLIPIDDRYKNLNSFWMNYSQIVNNGTVNINIYNGEEDFICDIQLENSILRNKELTKLYNQVLDGHKITKLAEVIHYTNKDFVYTKGNWYFFNGSIWKLDEDNLSMKKSILDSTNCFNKISSHYENKKTKDNSQQLVKNIKSLITKINKPGFKDDIIKEAKMFYNDAEFMAKLNSKKHLVPFTDGVYDLLSNEFRKTNKDDYINLTVNFPYHIENENQEVYKFLREVLPSKGVRDYVLKKMSECLNGDIPNTYFLMFIGDTGANGKSQLLNLMKLAMGEFGEKVEVTLLTRKRNNANEANSEKIKLLNKRFAFLSEPEDGEKINIGLLKELTGSEEIVARGLYQDSLSFVMEAKLFLACNELPEIKGEDTALWRRIRAVDFPSRFVDDPKEEGEYKIDRTLPSRMREDVTWRQTFMKILLTYYFRDDIKEPEEVKVKTSEYQSNNDPNRKFVELYLEKKPGEGVNWTKLWGYYQNWYMEENGNVQIKKSSIKKYFEDRVFKTKQIPVSKDIGRGWCGWRLKEELFQENQENENDKEQF